MSKLRVDLIAIVTVLDCMIFVPLVPALLYGINWNHTLTGAEFAAIVAYVTLIEFFVAPFIWIAFLKLFLTNKEANLYLARNPRSLKVPGISRFLTRWWDHVFPLDAPLKDPQFLPRGYFVGARVTDAAIRAQLIEALERTTAYLQELGPTNKALLRAHPEFERKTGQLLFEDIPLIEHEIQRLREDEPFNTELLQKITAHRLESPEDLKAFLAREDSPEFYEALRSHMVYWDERNFVRMRTQGVPMPTRVGPTGSQLALFLLTWDKDFRAALLPRAAFEMLRLQAMQIFRVAVHTGTPPDTEKFQQDCAAKLAELRAEPRFRSYFEAQEKRAWLVKTKKREAFVLFATFVAYMIAHVFGIIVLLAKANIR